MEAYSHLSSPSTSDCNLEALAIKIAKHWLVQTSEDLRLVDEFASQVLKGTKASCRDGLRLKGSSGGWAGEESFRYYAHRFQSRSLGVAVLALLGKLRPSKCNYFPGTKGVLEFLNLQVGRRPGNIGCLNHRQCTKLYRPGLSSYRMSTICCFVDSRSRSCLLEGHVRSSELHSCRISPQSTPSSNQTSSTSS